VVLDVCIVDESDTNTRVISSENYFIESRCWFGRDVPKTGDE
jgi:hypothetical protein